MASAIEDVQSLLGEKVSDQDGLKIGKIKQLYSAGDGDSVMWVTVETSLGVANKRVVFIPLARLKHERDELRVPYSAQHVQSSPDVEAGERLSEGDDQALRAYYSVGLGDQELRTDNDSYAGQVPDEDGPAGQIDAERAREPERDTGEAAERLRGENRSDEDEDEDKDKDKDKPRKATVDDLLEEKT